MLFRSREYWAFLLGAVLCSVPLVKALHERIEASPSETLRTAAHTFSVVCYLFCLIWSVSFLVMGAHNPFIYFQF